MKGSINMLNLSIIAMIFILISMSLWQAATAVHFEHASFDNANLADLKFVKQDAWYTGQDASLKDAAIWLNPDPTEVETRAASNIGRVIYNNPILFTSTKSFTTCFTFQIITTAKYGLCGSGLAFFISDSEKSPPNSVGRYLGLFNPNATQNGTQPSTRFFAVEFDTHVSDNLNDPSASHIGIDINSLKSISYADSSPGSMLFPQLFLYNNYSFTVWVEYNASANSIEVWMTNSSTYPAATRPLLPILRQICNLHSNFGDQLVYFGFSSTNKATEDGMQGAALFSWSFTDEDLSSEKKGGKSNLLLLVLVPVACFVFIIIAICFFIYNYKYFNCMRIILGRGSGNSIRPEYPPNRLILRQYTHRELKNATNNFSKENEVGRGAFSIVYKATQPDGSIMAVKKLNQGVRKEDEFASAMKIISACRHKNILELQGWYYSKREAMLVYKFMSNSSLDEYLYGQKQNTHVLPSSTRLRILHEVSLALGYMHTDLDECVLHRDVKAANVLLADGLKAMVADFGLACLVNHDGEVATSTPVGTLGYIAPEVLMEGRATEKSDVYSYGVLVFEVAYGRRVIGKRNPPSDQNSMSLLQWVWQLKERNQHIEALDPRMDIGAMPESQVEKWRNVLHVAFLCCNPSPEERPTMKEVSQTLQGDKQELLRKPLPSRPPLQIDLKSLMYVNSTSNVYFSALMSDLTSSTSCGSGTNFPSISEINSLSTSPSIVIIEDSVSC